MRFEQTTVDGVLLLEPVIHADDRGSFTRLSCVDEFKQAGIDFTPSQSSLSHNIARHTLRGMHYCREPEAKLVRCVRGRIFDVALDIRKGSFTYRRYASVELSADNMRGLFIPAGVAHGFLTLEEHSDVLYQIDRAFRPGFDAGLRWNDPIAQIDWPAPPAVINQRDANYPDFTPSLRS
jgi:dTDP-4-dehydrorhamnose 3,5-epimerase